MSPIVASAMSWPGRATIVGEVEDIPIPPIGAASPQELVLAALCRLRAQMDFAFLPKIVRLDFNGQRLAATVDVLLHEEDQPLSSPPEEEVAEEPPSPRMKILQTCREVRDMLLAKNEAYGNSALDPVRIFSTADASEQIRVRIDDKLSRISRGESLGEDTLLDLIGYLILLRISMT